MLKRCPSEYFTEIEFQLPERNELTENIAVTSKISMWRTCRNDLGPGLGITVTTAISHIFCLQARRLSENCSLDVLGHDIVRYLRCPQPFQSGTCLVAMPYFMCRSPTCRCLQFIHITKFGQSTVIVSSMITGGIHIAGIHHMQVHAVLEQFIVFIQSHQFHLRIHNLIISIDQCFPVRSMSTETLGRECEMCIMSHHIEILIHSVTQQFIPIGSLMFSYIEIAVYLSGSDMYLYRLSSFIVRSVIQNIH